MNQLVQNRPIRSYVKRQGRMTPRQAQALAKFWPKYGLQIEKQPYDIKDIFNRSAPLIMEIGFGMGASLLQSAQAKPDSNFIGIEVHLPGVGALLADMDECKIENIRIFQNDAVEVLTSCIADNSIDKIMILFPDPWPKKRHHKRRLIQPDFLKLVFAKLKSGGHLHLATDWQPYASQMMQVVSAFTGFVNAAGAGCYANGTLRPQTKFEMRGRQLGHQIWDLLFVRE